MNRAAGPIAALVLSALCLAASCGGLRWVTLEEAAWPLVAERGKPAIACLPAPGVAQLGWPIESTQEAIDADCWSVATFKMSINGGWTLVADSHILNWKGTK